MLPEDYQHKIQRSPLRVGMRSIKTVVAVFICCCIDTLRGVVPFQSTIAAILCIQPDTENSVDAAISRIIGTILGGVSAALALMAFNAIGVSVYGIPFYLFLSLLLIPLIYIPVQLGWPNAAALTCIVFLVISLSYTGDTNPMSMAITRVLDTLVGILVALPVNILLPSNKAAEEDGEAAPSGEASPAPPPENPPAPRDSGTPPDGPSPLPGQDSPPPEEDVPGSQAKEPE